MLLCPHFTHALCSTMVPLSIHDTRECNVQCCNNNHNNNNHNNNNNISDDDNRTTLLTRGDVSPWSQHLQATLLHGGVHRAVADAEIKYTLVFAPRNGNCKGIEGRGHVKIGPWP